MDQARNDKANGRNCRIYVGNIPKSMSSAGLRIEAEKMFKGVTGLITYFNPDEPTRNRGFCFIEFAQHRLAIRAKQKLLTFKFCGCEVIADWADPQQEPNSEVMASVKVLYVKNLVFDVTDEELQKLFEVHGIVERVKRIKDYAFVHFSEREDAINAMVGLNGHSLHGIAIEIVLAKPPIDKTKREDILKNREKRVMQIFSQRVVKKVGLSPTDLVPVPIKSLLMPPTIASCSSKAPGMDSYLGICNYVNALALNLAQTHLERTMKRGAGDSVSDDKKKRKRIRHRRVRRKVTESEVQTDEPVASATQTDSSIDLKPKALILPAVLPQKRVENKPEKEFIVPEPIKVKPQQKRRQENDGRRPRERKQGNQTKSTGSGPAFPRNEQKKAGSQFASGAGDKPRHWKGQKPSRSSAASTWDSPSQWA